MSQIGSAEPLPLSSAGSQNVGSQSSGSSDSAFSSLNTDEFMDIILSEMQNQDPLEPNDTQAMLEQLSSIRSIESDIELADKLEAIATQGALTEGASMIGMFVSGLDENSERALDWVVSVSKTPDDVVLNLQSGQRVPIGQVDEVIDGDDAQTLLQDLFGASDEDEMSEAEEATP